MKRSILVFAIVICSASGYAACPSGDVTGDCFVGLADLAIMAEEWVIAPNMAGFGVMANQWMTEGVPADPKKLVWVVIEDPGVDEDGDGTPDHEGFTGRMSKYETTNAQYCEYLNAALGTEDITMGTVHRGYAVGAEGSNTGEDFVREDYYFAVGWGDDYNGATNGGKARIIYHEEAKWFSVEGGYEDDPVTHVTWYGAKAFCAYYGYRLPTEWEWQAVADYDGSYKYGCGVGIDNSIANYYNSAHPEGTTTVGSWGIYGYGLCDLAGNVLEMTDSVLPGGIVLLRGGSWYDKEANCAVSGWMPWGSYLTSPRVGFRVCR
jgi:formylglycine-generating enzyme required for sulfatase activity